MKKYLLIVVAVIAVGAAVRWYFSPSQVSARFVKEVDTCDAVAKELRFSCFRSSLEKNYGHSFNTLIKQIKADNQLSFKSDDSSYAVFGTNCHTFYHAVGDFIAIHSTADLPTQISDCPLACTSGCIMGLYKRIGLREGYGTELLKTFVADCPKDSIHQCTHEIGHALHDKYVEPILKTLDTASEKNYGIKYASYNYAPSATPNLDQPFEDCKAIVPETELSYCYTGIGHNLYLYSEFNPNGFDAMFKECDKTEAKHVDDCYDFLVYRIGINDAATKFLASDFGSGIKVCDQITTQYGKPQLKHHCYLGMGGGIGLFIDSEYSGMKIDTNNLAQVQKAVLGYIALCDHSEEGYKEDCYKGLLGTKVKKLYKSLNLNNLIIEEILPNIKSDFEVVG
ncbi:MAG TPA: hypothetical protein VGQ87_03460 [Patescibacteria group bacterium]|jgi:hypothetical protein|nr:hypothetical protein [Patescibacteria group bacterium]